MWFTTASRLDDSVSLQGWQLDMPRQASEGSKQRGCLLEQRQFETFPRFSKTRSISSEVPKHSTRGCNFLDVNKPTNDYSNRFFNHLKPHALICHFGRLVAKVWQPELLAGKTRRQLPAQGAFSTYNGFWNTNRVSFWTWHWETNTLPLNAVSSSNLSFPKEAASHLS